MIRFFYFLVLCLISTCFASAQKKEQASQPSIIQFGDPFILNHEGTYYMYGTMSADTGFKVYQSTDLKNWAGPVGATNGFALVKNDVWGNTNYWAPEVYHLNNRFYMFFSVEEHIAAATSDSPVGPFVQEKKAPLLETKAIDTHLFIDEDGRKYLYYVAFNNGNLIWMCEMNDDLLSVKENTVKFCFGCSQPWEFSKKEPVANINEGPFMLKHKGLYYLVFSANHFVNPDYGIGYATAPHPTGPWTKYKGNPIVCSNDQIIGTGHCAFFNDNEGNLNVVYHSHFSPTEVNPRLAYINQCKFVPDPNGGADILSIVAPTLTPMLKN